ncbi:hypothetical protein TNCV_3885691 [Trichonephila clavipes]|nr:hypothetical protein TNCV_3885691 [Trichonephila clavipes]
MLKTCSTGERSNELSGRGSVLMAQGQSRGIRVVCGLALSCTDMMVICFKNKARFIVRSTLCDASSIATMMIDCYSCHSPNVMESTANVLMAAVRSVHFVDTFLTSNIAAASTFAQLCLYISGDDLLSGMTTQLLEFQQYNHVQSQSVAYKIFENIMMTSLIFSPLNQNWENEKRINLPPL